MDFYTVSEVAEMFKVHPATIKREIARGNIIGFKVGNESRVTSEELQRYACIKSHIKSDNEIKLENNIKQLSRELEIKNIFIENIKKELLTIYNFK